jgi:hypothetical protein
VLGLPGETSDTLGQTGRYIKSIVASYPNIIGVEVSPLTVTSGSSAYRDLMQARSTKYSTRMPPYDVIEMSNDYFACQTKVSRNSVTAFIVDLAKELHAIRPDGLAIDVKGISDEEARPLNLPLHKLDQYSPLLLAGRMKATLKGVGV